MIAVVNAAFIFFDGAKHGLTALGHRATLKPQLTFCCDTCASRYLTCKGKDKQGAQIGTHRSMFTASGFE